MIMLLYIMRLCLCDVLVCLHGVYMYNYVMIMNFMHVKLFLLGIQFDINKGPP